MSLLEGPSGTQHEEASVSKTGLFDLLIEDSEVQESHTEQLAILSAHFGRAPYPSDNIEDQDEVEVCQEWEKGNCAKGEKCRFRHKKPFRRKGRPVSSFNASWLNNLAAKVHEEDENLKKTMSSTMDEDDKPTKPTPKELVVEERDISLEKMYQELGKKRRREHSDNGTLQSAPIIVDVPQPISGSSEGSDDDDWDVLDSDKERKNNNDSSSEAVNIVSREDVERRRREEAMVFEQYIVLQSSMVTCGAGLEIRNVVPGYDLRQIAIKNLPQDTTKTEIEALLLAYDGISKLDFYILDLKEVGRTLQAVVIADAVHSAGMVNGLNGFKLRDRNLLFEICANATWTTGSMEMNQPSLTLSWKVPPAGSRGLANFKFERDIAGLYERLYSSDGVQMDTSYLLNPENGFSTDEVTLTVDFNDWDNLQAAVRDIMANRPAQIPSLKCSHPEPHQYSIVISVQQYQAQAKQWGELADTKDKNAAKITFSTVGQNVSVNVLGSDREATGALKVRVEKLAGGEILDGACWHPTFALAEDSDIFFNEVRKACGVELSRDPPIRAVRLYGDPLRLEQAERKVRDEAHRRAQVKTRTTLNDDCADFFVRDGIVRLQELVGEGNVDLNITAKWSVIMMQGGDEATHHLERLMEESHIHDFDEPDDGVVVVETCPICFNDVDSPERLGCGHGYCAGCLSNYLAAATNNKTLPVVCMGNDGTCAIPIALPFLRRFLPHQSFKQLVEAAFANYLERNPQEFRYCRTPDCRQTYRKQPETQAENIRCPSCFVGFCGACEQDHPRMNCKEYRLSKDEAEQERLNGILAQQHGYQRCPRCAVWIEKTHGCNHMTCKCGAHICWICLGVFTPGTIYPHIRSAHGQ
ncbi:hypothetical protein CPB83DRAFT_861355 [Crepidotus variabilis]|uniref:Uncharacterized protein n=1 Tax=Crepidotus variabilis TaxID=179855 RepID=A0A9P6E8F3_9AGAR|nr:hypothetical protein CPB83DRAFT_861355 [Crepidotus variabilis]